MYLLLCSLAYETNLCQLFSCVSWSGSCLVRELRNHCVQRKTFQTCKFCIHLLIWHSKKLHLTTDKTIVEFNFTCGGQSNSKFCMRKFHSCFVCDSVFIKSEKILYLIWLGEWNVVVDMSSDRIIVTKTHWAAICDVLYTYLRWSLRMFNEWTQPWICESVILSCEYGMPTNNTHVLLV